MANKFYLWLLLWLRLSKQIITQTVQKTAHDFDIINVSNKFVGNLIVATAHFRLLIIRNSLSRLWMCCVCVYFNLTYLYIWLNQNRWIDMKTNMKRIFQARFMSPSAVFTEQFSIFHFSIHMVKLYIHCHFRSNKWKICVYGRIKAKYIKSSVWSHFIVDVVVVAFRYSFMIKIAHRGLATSRGVRNNNKKSMYCIKN